MTRTVLVANRHPRLRADPREVRRAVAVLDAAADRFGGGCPPGELSIVFVTDRELAGLHGRFLDDPSTTDVITFEGLPAAGVAGEICVSADTAYAYSTKHRREFATELLLYVVHGWLHLAGYDDLRPGLKRRMRSAEARALALLQQAGALPRFTLRPARRRSQ